MRVVTSNGVTSDGVTEHIAKSLLAEPKMPVTLCAIGADAQSTLIALSNLSKNRPGPIGALFIAPMLPDDMAWLKTRLPPLGIFAHQKDQTVQQLTTAIRKAGHRVHLDLLTGTDLQSLTGIDHYKITMSLAALARGMWPH